MKYSYLTDEELIEKMARSDALGITDYLNFSREVFKRFVILRTRLTTAEKRTVYYRLQASREKT